MGKLLFLIFGILGLSLTYKNSMSSNNIAFIGEKRATSMLLNKVVLNEIEDFGQDIDQDELLANVDDFIDMPKDGTSWKIFGETGMSEYSFKDDEGYDWLGVRPKFKENVKKLDGKEILVQGYMFPLEQGEKQSRFLLGPFPITCPYHPHVSSNLTIEVYAKDPILYTYDAINIRGKLELVKNDNLYNIFYRMKNSRVVE
ncbi:DUF3299 domain-containing protein [Rickettsiales bacterium]|nr:DUF3299 domain-containing protein [Rickettsiales bacterium]